MRIQPILMGSLLSTSHALSNTVLDHPCVKAQIRTEGLDPSKVSADQFLLTEHTEASSFYGSKPKVLDHQIEIESFVDSEENGQSCKFKNRDAIGQKIPDILLSKKPSSCAEANLEMIQDSISSWTPALVKRFEKSAYVFESGGDQDAWRGDQWKASHATIAENGKALTLKASSLRTPAWIPVLGGMRYCKLLSVDGAKEFVSQLLPGFLRTRS